MRWVEAPPFGDRAYDLAEMFAGQARVSRLARSRGWRAICHDMSYDMSLDETSRSCMDLCGAAGFLFLVCSVDLNYMMRFGHALTKIQNETGH